MLRCFRRLAMSITVLAATVSAASAGGCTDRATLLILDASVSMLSEVASSGRNRFDLARVAVSDFVDRYPPYGQLALRLYGSESTAIRNNCRDSRLAVGFAPVRENGGAIKLALLAAHARGVTPIAYALDQAVADFPGGVAEKIIVLVTDGIESCGGDPCAMAKTLAAQGFVIHVVGFLVESPSRRELQCVAREGAGRYFDVRRPIDLPDTLAEALTPCPVALMRPRGPYVLFAAARVGTAVHDAALAGARLTVPGGHPGAGQPLS
jgi:Ca-activated chloride channel family protein